MNYTQNTCKPYEIAPCGHHKNETYYHDCKGYTQPPKCTQECQQGYSVSYHDDKIFGGQLIIRNKSSIEGNLYKIPGKSAYFIRRNVSAIQRDIMNYGPVVAAFTLYTDFMLYKSGIYKHTAGAAQGGHVVKIIGWGSENDVPYWIMANSWNTDWGENGELPFA
ncbi:papain family cysteine protease [Ancylostoma caninum]|uniref:Papain family cysteine protease n=1 Tax=Ancylostoma caninum TaxID=29170 RepID=A0A368GSI6_ANCCA|nr:papain family cysteine protease [Ancylostoma caninum]